MERERVVHGSTYLKPTSPTTFHMPTVNSCPPPTSDLPQTYTPYLISNAPINTHPPPTSNLPQTCSPHLIPTSSLGP